MKENIIGIQQVGVGIPDVHKAWEFYRKNFGMDIPIFQESAEAKLMTKYTGGTVHSRSAVLAINIQGGSGLEIWQYTSRESAKPNFDVQLGDLGIFITKIKSKNINESFNHITQNKADIAGNKIVNQPLGKPTFFVKDKFSNLFQLVENDTWFRNENYHSGGVCGATIGVSDIEKSKAFYGKLLGYDTVVYDETGVFNDFANLPGGNQKFRRVLLTRSFDSSGTFSKLLGKGEIELVQALERTPKKIFENRYWGDQGFIHLCFDVYNMKDLEKHFESKGFPFTINSSSAFDMGEAAGHFTYCEDPDGTWIEFVETYRIPILKVIGWYLNVGKRDRKKPLPDWMLGALRFTRVKS